MKKQDKIYNIENQQVKTKKVNNYLIFKNTFLF